MNKEGLLKRKESLIKDRKHHEGMCLLVDGALQDCDYWLGELEKSEKEHQEEDNS